MFTMCLDRCVTRHSEAAEALAGRYHAGMEPVEDVPGSRVSSLSAVVVVGTNGVVTQNGAIEAMLIPSRLAS